MCMALLLPEPSLSISPIACSKSSSDIGTPSSCDTDRSSCISISPLPSLSNISKEAAMAFSSAFFSAGVLATLAASRPAEMAERKGKIGRP